MSGNPAAKPIYASVITAVEILPENLDLAGYPVKFYPGRIMLAFADPGAKPHVIDYRDGPVTWRCEQVRIAIGEAVDDVAKFAAGYETVFRLLKEGADPDAHLLANDAQDAVDAFAQDAAERLSGDDDELASLVVDMAKNYVRNRARKQAAQ